MTRPAQLLLFEIERAWADSQDLRTEYNVSDEKATLRRRGLGRARRAVQWVEKLSKLIDVLGERVDPQSRAEVAAYGLVIRGSASFDKGDWLNSLECLAVAREALAVLTRCSSDSGGEALASSFVDVNEPYMRFCAYQLGEEEQDMDAVAKHIAKPEVRGRVCPNYEEIFKQLESSAATKTKIKTKEPVQIEWRNQIVPIRNAELMAAVVRVRQERAALSDSFAAVNEGNEHRKAVRSGPKKTKPQRLSHAERTARKRSSGTACAGQISAAAASRALVKTQSTNDPYDKALAALADGELVARRLVEYNAESLARSHSARFAAVGEDLKVAHEWFNYCLMSLQIKRSARLVDEVRIKAENRERRKKDALARKINFQTGSTTRKVKGSRGKDCQTQGAKKPQPGSRAKQPRTVARRGHRRPAKSGTKALRARQTAALKSRVNALAEGRARRRAARAIPTLVKLLDTCEANLVNISALSMVESDPDASSVIDAKAAWYRAELLRHLARAHRLADQRGEACLLLRRAALSARQARQAFDLIDERDVADEMDRDLPPVMSEETFGKTDELIDADLRQVQREAFFISQGHLKTAAVGGIALSLSQNKAGQQLRSLALKYVDFDPVDIEDALRMDSAWRNECENELAGTFDGGKKSAVPSKTKRAPSPQQQRQLKSRGKEHILSDDEAAEQFQEAAEYEDSGDGFAPAKEQNQADSEVDNRQQKEKRKGWLGGWFVRK